VDLLVNWGINDYLEFKPLDGIFVFDRYVLTICNKWI
jgi:hypothetical protein